MAAAGDEPPASPHDKPILVVQPSKQPWKQVGRYGTVGLELVVSMGVGYFGGRWADGKLGTKFLALLGLVVGIYAGFRNLMRAANEMQREAEREEAREQAANAAGKSADERRDDGGSSS